MDLQSRLEEICRDRFFCGDAESFRTSNLAPHRESLLLRLYADIQIVAGEGEGFAINRVGLNQQTTEDTEDTEGLHFASAAFILRWRTISYNMTPAATDTFSDGTFPSMGIETRKSHFFATRSWTPLPSEPNTMAQSML